MNYKAGWGYMMLTNFLPNSGNGTFKIHAIVTDNEGSTADLGVKTIQVDNANAVKPFGAIDTPTQGGSASGTDYRNQGWVLTPSELGSGKLFDYSDEQVKQRIEKYMDRDKQIECLAHHFMVKILIFKKVFKWGLTFCYKVW